MNEKSKYDLQYSSSGSRKKTVKAEWYGKGSLFGKHVYYPTCEDLVGPQR